MNFTRTCLVIMILLYGSIRALAEPKGIKSLPVGGRPDASIGRLVARSIGEASSSRIALTWSQNGIKRHQVIQLPTPWYCDGYEDYSYRPVGVQFRISDEPGLMIVANRESGVYDVRSPIVYRLHKGAWRHVASNPKQSEFTDFGSCYIKHGRLYAWDYEMANNKGHADPQRYWLRVFTISRTRVRLRSSKMSREEYVHIDFPVTSSKIRPSADPMREFGLRWKWWGDR